MVERPTWSAMPLDWPLTKRTPSSPYLVDTPSWPARRPVASPFNSASTPASFSSIGHISVSDDRQMSRNFSRPPSRPSPVLRRRKSFSSPKRPMVIDPGFACVPPPSPSLYLNDADARRILKAPLASPTSFDEALEFGFPSNAKPVAQTPRQLPRFSDNDVHNYLRDSTFWDNEYDLERFSSASTTRVDSLFEEGEASDCDTDKDAPRTPPLDASCYRHHHHAVSSEMPAPFNRKLWDGDMFAGSREMTLHLTLTRPDMLQGGHYRCVVAEDVPVLESLLPSLDYPSMHIREPDPGAVRGLWKKLIPKRT